MCNQHLAVVNLNNLLILNFFFFEREVTKNRLLGQVGRQCQPGGAAMLVNVDMGVQALCCNHEKESA